MSIAAQNHNQIQATTPDKQATTKILKLGTALQERARATRQQHVFVPEFQIKYLAKKSPATPIPAKFVKPANQKGKRIYECYTLEKEEGEIGIEEIDMEV